MSNVTKESIEALKIFLSGLDIRHIERIWEENQGNFCDEVKLVYIEEKLKRNESEY